jgi:hypothetical protein
VFTENGVLIDFEELRKVVDKCDVFTIGFRLFPERLIVDTRTNGEQGPMMEVVEPVGTVEERFFWLGQRRPQFGVPESFTFFIWPHSVRYLEESGMMDRIRQRIYPLDTEDGRLGRSVAESMWNLILRERKATFDAVTGHNYHTLWEREPSEDAG